jgi:hypothetical protein
LGVPTVADRVAQMVVKQVIEPDLLPVFAGQLNPLLRGWIAYYGRYAPSALYPLLRYINQTLLAWAMRKFKRFKGHKIRASQFL